MRICGLMCARDSHELLKASIGNLAMNGITDFYLYDHGSDPDLALELGRALGPAGVRLRILRKETAPFYQREMLLALSELARADGFEVGVAFDADEFWCSTSEDVALAEQITKELAPGVDALRVPVISYVQHTDERAFSVESLSRCRYVVTPVADSARSYWEQVEGGTPFVAVPFPAKVVARLRPDLAWTEGQHDVDRASGELVVAEAAGIVVRHLTLPSRTEVAGKRTHGRNRAAAGCAPDIGWQLRRLADMTDEQLDAYWTNNSWRRHEGGHVLVGTYDRLVEDDALVRLGRALARWARPPGADDVHAVEDGRPGGGVSAEQLERALERLVDEAGRAAAATAEGAAVQARALEALQREIEARGAWALQLDERLRRVHSSRLWRWGLALHLAPSATRPGRS